MFHFGVLDLLMTKPRPWKQGRQASMPPASKKLLTVYTLRGWHESLPPLLEHWPLLWECILRS